MAARCTQATVAPRVLLTAMLWTAWTACPASAQSLPTQPAQHLPIAAFSSAAVGTPPAPWRAVNLPAGKAPASQFDITVLDGRSVLRLRSDQSYGTLSHPTTNANGAAPGLLRWRWRLDVPLARSDLRRKDSDDAALKVCALFDQPLGTLPFGERALLQLARAVTGESLPSATLCYVWDTTLPVGTVLPNAYTQRVRYLVVDSGARALSRWSGHQRDLGADFAQAFGWPSATIPPLVAIAVGADADNTGGNSLGYLDDITLHAAP
jgi:hypothetical protein